MNRANHYLAVVLVLLGAASYGIGGVAIKLAISDGWSVQHLTIYQVLSGAVLLWLAVGLTRLRRKSSSLKSTWRAWLMLIVIGVVGLSLTTVLYNEALARLNASLGIVLLFQYTWITILLNSIHKRRWPSWRERIAIVCIAFGTVLAVGLLEQDFSRLDGLGVLLGLLSAVTYSLFFFLVGFLPNNLDPMAKSAVMSTSSIAFIMLIQAPAVIEWTMNESLIGWGILLGSLGTAFPFFCFNYGIPKIGSSLAALLGSMELPAAVIAAYLILGEPLTGWQGAGIAMIIAGIMAAQTKSPQPATAGKEGED